jgi:hypothetical protein
VHVRTHLAREPGGPVVTRRGWRGGSCREVDGHTPMMHDHGPSDSPIVPTKFPNKAGEPAAEGMEGRGLAKGNRRQPTASRAQDRVDAPSALERVRQGAERDKTVRFTTLLHHVYNIDHLRAAYLALKRDAAPTCPFAPPFPRAPAGGRRRGTRAGPRPPPGRCGRRLAAAGPGPCRAGGGRFRGG